MVHFSLQTLFFYSSPSTSARTQITENTHSLRRTSDSVLGEEQNENDIPSSKISLNIGLLVNITLCNSTHHTAVGSLKPSLVTDCNTLFVLCRVSRIDNSMHILIKLYGGTAFVPGFEVQPSAGLQAYSELACAPSDIRKENNV